MTRARLLLPLLLLVAAAASADTLVERYESTHPFTGSRFSLENVNGSVTVDTWDRAAVRIEAEKRIRTRRRDDAVEAMRALRIEVRETGGALEVKTHYPRRDGPFRLFQLFTDSEVNANVRYRITVPRSVRVEIDTVNAGIDVDGVVGGLALETVNGRIEVVRSGGSFKASTVNGSIDAQLIEVDPSPLRISTVNGKVALVLPADIRADVEVSTVNGKIRSDLPMTATEAGRRKLRGSINGGGQVPIRISTVNGSVSLASN